MRKNKIWLFSHFNGDGLRSLNFRRRRRERSIGACGPAADNDDDALERVSVSLSSFLFFTNYRPSTFRFF
ncbi:hypothetical protein LguiA_016820 [Lonicera macranthoides]